MKLVNYDVMLLIETKIPDEVYFQNRIVYDVVCLMANPTASGGSQEGGRNGYNGDNGGVIHLVRAITHTKHSEL